jgi:RNA polymerase primary sigma factor
LKQQKLRTGDRQRTDYMNRIINFVPTQQELDRANANKGLVVYTLKRFRGLADDQDLVQAGFLGLVRAAHVYDASKGKFSNCAIPWILQAMRFEVERSGRTVIIPLPIINRLFKVQGCQNRLRNRFHREPTTQEIADTLELKEHQVKEALEIQRNHVSLNTPVNQDDENLQKIDALPDKSTLPDPEKELTDKTFEALAKLKPIEQDVILQSVVNNIPLCTIGIKYNLSRESVRKIRTKALVNLKRILEVVA